MERVRRLVAAVWFGSAIFLMLTSSAAFRAAGNTSIAADVVGAMLTRWHYVALAAPLVLFGFALRRSRAFLVAILFSCVLLAATQSFVDLRIRAIRRASPVSVSQLDRDDPVRRRFGALHGASMGLLLLQAIGAGLVVMSGFTRRTEPAAIEMPPTEPASETFGVSAEELSMDRSAPGDVVLEGQEEDKRDVERRDGSNPS